LKTLYLLRHAKSSWKHNVDDHKRSLKGRGKRDAMLVSNHIKDKTKPPQKIFSSDANRAKLTARFFKDAWNISDEDFITNHDLYDFSGQQVMEVIKNIDNSLDRVMIVGHNHAFTSIVNMLGDNYIDNLPTCGFVEIQFSVDDWKSANYGMTQQIIFPRDLKPKSE